MSVEAPKTLRNISELAERLANMSLSEMLTHYRERLSTATTDRERAHINRQIAKIEDSIGATLGLKRRINR